ncbi:MAG: SdrD B-like domain-containing protein [Chloroflexota bacterium]
MLLFVFILLGVASQSFMLQMATGHLWASGESVASLALSLLPRMAIAQTPLPDLLIDKRVSNPSPLPGETFIYTIRYRCASLTENCLAAQIADTVPPDLEIASFSGVSGNIATVNQGNNTITWDLESGNEAGQLEAGSAGLVSIWARFPVCGAQSSTPGAILSNIAIFSEARAGSVSSLANSADITVPTIEDCPLPPAPDPTGFSKTGASNIAPGVSSHNFRINLPANASGTSYVMSDNTPSGMTLKRIRLGGANSVLGQAGATVDLLCGGIWYANAFNNALNLATHLRGDAALNCTTEPTFGTDDGDSLFTNVEAFRVTVPDGTAAGGRIDLSYAIDSTYPVGGTIVNSAIITEAAGIDVNGDGASGEVLEASSQVNLLEAYPIFRTNKLFIVQPGYFNRETPASSILDGNGNLPEFIQSPNNSRYTDLDLTTVYLAENDAVWAVSGRIDRFSATGQNIVDPVVIDDLPPEFDFIEDTETGNFIQVAVPDPAGIADAYNPFMNPACRSPIITIIDDFDGTRDRIILEFPGCILYGGLDRTAALGFYISARLKAGTSAGMATENTMQATTTSLTALKCGTGANAQITDTCTNQGNGVTIPNLLIASANKTVQGLLNTEFPSLNDLGQTNQDGSAVYELIIDHVGNVDYTQIDLVDILPFIGDTGVIDLSSRGSAWSMELAAPILIERYDPSMNLWFAVPASDLSLGPYYSSSTDPCRLDLFGLELAVDEGQAINPPGCEANPWTGPTATSAVGARSFGFRFAPATPLRPGEKLRTQVSVQPLMGEINATSGDIAWNSFAYGVTLNDPENGGTPTTLLATEPLGAGVELIETSTTAAIGDLVWLDSNNNGIQEIGEPPIANVRVNLYAADGSTPILDTSGNQKSTTTGTNGTYLFWGLAPNTPYVIRLDNATDYAPTAPLYGYILTTAETSGNETTDSDAILSVTNGYPEISATTGAAGTEVRTYDFGFINPASVGNYVWDDQNGDGVQDNEEPGFAEITITLLDSNGAIVDTQVTDATGRYHFRDVVPGLYSIQFDPNSLPVTRTFTAQGISGNVATDSDANASSGETAQFVLLAGQNDLTWDAGLIQPPPSPASIQGRAWSDLNDDGQDNQNEPGVPGVQVLLVDSLGLPIASTFTDVTGEYLFDNLTPSQIYQVIFVSDNTQMITTNQDVLGDDTIDSDANPTTGETPPVTPVASELISDIDVGLISKLSLGNQIWFDINNSGGVDPNEAGLAGFTVRLLNNIGTAILTTTTDSAGKYVFTGLDAGDYMVEVEVPAGYVSSIDTASTSIPNLMDGDDNGVDTLSSIFATSLSNTSLGSASLLSSTIRSAVITLSAEGSTAGEASIGESDHGSIINGAIDTTPDAKAYYTVDFGFYRPVQVGNLVWLDDNRDAVTDTTDNNGLFDPNAGEVPVGNVLVQAWLDNGDGQFEAATDGAVPGTPDGIDTTDTNGEYTITNLPPGTYWIVLPAINFDGPLTNYVSSTGAGDPDEQSLLADQQDDGGDDFVNGAIIAAGLITLTSASEPAGEASALNSSTSPEPLFIDIDANWLVDFGFVPGPVPSLELKKRLVSPAGGRILVGDTLRFTLQITNSGDVAVTELTLSDTYDITILELITTSIPYDAHSDGKLTWRGNYQAGTGNLLGTLPLAPSDSFIVTLDFRVIAPTRP